MTTKTAGQEHTPRLALTLEAQYAAAKGDPVMVSGNYECGKADGSAPVIGFVAQRNVGHGTFGAGNAGQFPISTVPGDVSVDAIGVGVKTVVAGASITAGTKVGIGSDFKLHPAGGSVATIGVALMGGSTNASIDVLLGCF